MNLKFISDKKEHINMQIDGLKKNVKVLQRIGGMTKQDMGEEVKFQQERLSILEWAENHIEKDIQAKIKELENKLTPEQLACKRGIMRGLPYEVILFLCQIELLELVLGGEE